MDPPDRQTSLQWRLHLASPPIAVYQMLATNEGRSRFWAESAVEADGRVRFVFPNGQDWSARVVEQNPPHRFAIEYLGSVATFELRDDGSGGTDLTLTDRGVNAAEMGEVQAGWVSVLLALKAAVDHGVDLRNHKRDRTWDAGFVDN